MKRRCNPSGDGAARGEGGNEGRRAKGSNKQVTCKEKKWLSRKKGSSSLNNNI
jgi:hypothetical protein